MWRPQSVPSFPCLADGARLSVCRTPVELEPMPTIWSLTATSPKTNITTKTTVTKTTVTASSKPKSVAATAATLPKTNDGNWIIASVALFLLGTTLLGAACRC